MAEKNIPLVTVGIPTYNRPNGLKDTLDCIIKQTYTNLEIIISDNKSEEDETEKIAKKFIAFDKRIKYYKQKENIGAILNFEFLLNAANGEFFMWAADDDLWDENFIELIIEKIKGNESYVGGFCPYIFIDESGKFIGEPRIFDYSSKYRLMRYLKFLWKYDDECVYGIYRKDKIKNIRVPHLYWINNIICDTAYPMIFYFLSKGNLIIVGDSTLCFKRVYPIKRHDYINNNFYLKLRNYLVFIKLKIQLFYTSFLYIYKGSNSFILSFISCPFLLTKAIIDVVKPLIFSLLKRIK